MVHVFLLIFTKFTAVRKMLVGMICQLMLILVPIYLKYIGYLGCIFCAFFKTDRIMSLKTK